MQSPLLRFPCSLHMHSSWPTRANTFEMLAAFYGLSPGGKLLQYIGLTMVLPCFDSADLKRQESSYKRVKGRSHTVEKRKAIHPQNPHATSQPSR